MIELSSIYQCLQEDCTLSTTSYIVHSWNVNHEWIVVWIVYIFSYKEHSDLFWSTYSAKFRKQSNINSLRIFLNLETLLTKIDLFFLFLQYINSQIVCLSYMYSVLFVETG